jgi:hypothetical protein
MSKPLGIRLEFGGGAHVVRPDQVENAVWDAVEAAVDAGWTVEEFRRECAEAWRSRLLHEADQARKEWKKGERL